MAIAVRCEACQIDASAATPSELHAFLAKHRDPDHCMQRAESGTSIAMRVSLPFRRSA
jgi:hypothetical protein